MDEAVVIPIDADQCMLYILNACWLPASVRQHTTFTVIPVALHCSVPMEKDYRRGVRREIKKEVVHSVLYAFVQ